MILTTLIEHLIVAVRASEALTLLVLHWISIQDAIVSWRTQIIEDAAKLVEETAEALNANREFKRLGGEILETLAGPGAALIAGGAAVALVASAFTKRPSIGPPETAFDETTDHSLLPSSAFVPSEVALLAKAPDLDCSVFSPKSVARSEEFLIQAVLHIADDERSAAVVARRSDSAAKLRASTPLLHSISAGEVVEIRLFGEGLVSSEHTQKLTWQGKSVAAQFVARVRDNAPSRVTAQIRVFVDGVPVGASKFVLDVAKTAVPENPKPATIPFVRYKKIFMSYASEDRFRVLEHSQILHRVGLDVFQDILSLTPGQRWKNALFSEIGDSDLFLLYWSQAAADCEWVLREAEYALECSNGSKDARPDIVPVILEGPPSPLPPPSLRSIHFNDPLRYVIAAHSASFTVTAASILSDADRASDASSPNS